MKGDLGQCVLSLTLVSHGNPSDPGCVYGSLCEADIVWDIGQLVARFLMHHVVSSVGQTVYGGMTRGEREDPPFSIRNRRAVDQSAGLVVCIHVNSAVNLNAQGMRTYFWPGNDRSNKLASLICRSAPTALGPPSSILRWKDPYAARPATKANDPRVRNVLEAYSMDAVLIECGFLSNARDREALVNPAIQKQIAMCISHGIADYFNVGFLNEGIL